MVWLGQCNKFNHNKRIQYLAIDLCKRTMCNQSHKTCISKKCLNKKCFFITWKKTSFVLMELCNLSDLLWMPSSHVFMKDKREILVLKQGRAMTSLPFQLWAFCSNYKNIWTYRLDVSIYHNPIICATNCITNYGFFHFQCAMQAYQTPGIIESYLIFLHRVLFFLSLTF